MRKVVVFAFSGEPASFAHAMLTAMDMKDRGYDVKEMRDSGAVEKPHSCPPERSEGSSNSRRIIIPKILRCAQNDERRSSSTVPQSPIRVRVARAFPTSNRTPTPRGSP